jgi:hypothetical protein
MQASIIRAHSIYFTMKRKSSFMGEKKTLDSNMVEEEDVLLKFYYILHCVLDRTNDLQSAKILFLLSKKIDQK